MELYYDTERDEWMEKICPFIGKPCISEECLFWDGGCLFLKCFEELLKK